jgi:hypothetical protein
MLQYLGLVSMGNKEWIKVVRFLQNNIDEWNLNYALCVDILNFI